MNRVEYQTVLFTRDCITDEDLNNFGYDGWKLSTVMPMESNPFALIGVFYREVVEEGLNAKILNKLGPFQTMMDLLKIFKINGDDKVQKLVEDALTEAEKSMDFFNTYWRRLNNEFCFLKTCLYICNVKTLEYDLD